MAYVQPFASSVERTTEYQKVAEVMSAAAKAGLVKIGFITEPSGAN